MRLLLLGCTGLVGRELMPQLLAAGHTLTVVSRQQRQLDGVSSVQADPSSQRVGRQGLRCSKPLSKPKAL